MSIVEDYLELTKKYKAEYGDKTLVLMEVGSFYEVYALIKPDGSYMGTNIEEFAKINEMVIARKSTCVGKMPVVMAGMGTAHADKYIQKMQEHDYTIVIYRQDPMNKTSRSLSEIISPGTYFQVENAKLTNNVMCIWLHQTKATKRQPCQITIGLANLDIYTGKTSLFQFVTSDNHSPATYDELERNISAHKPNECLLVANIPGKIVDDIIGFVGLEKTKIHKIAGPDSASADMAGLAAKATASDTALTICAQNAEKQVYQMEIIKKFFPQLSLTFPEMYPTHCMAIQAFCFLLDFVFQHNPKLTTKLAEPIFENYTNRLMLSNHSLSQLNITDDARQGGKLRSVSALLNNCVTTMGQRKFMYNLHYPITHKPTLQKSYDMTEHLLNQGEVYYQFIRNKLSSLSDLEKFARKIILRKVIPKNIPTLVEDLQSIESLGARLQGDKVLNAYLQNDASTSVAGTRCAAMALAIRTDLERVFNLEACRNLNELDETTPIINRGISKTIDDLLRNSIDGKDKLIAICNYLSGLIQQSEKKEASYVKIHETARSHAILTCTSRRTLLLKAAIKKEQVQAQQMQVRLSYKSKFSQTDEFFDFDLISLEYINHGNSKTEMVITSPQVRALTSEHEDNKIKLIREMATVFQNYLTEFAKFEPNMNIIIKYVTELDLLQCKAYTANKYNYCKPAFYEGATKSFFDFTGLRHPLIEHLQTQELYVTNDLRLGQAQQLEHTNGILLYGTNAVGKTSFIKSVGIAIIMAQAGLYVPCNSFIYEPYMNIFTRILGNDNIFKGLSTFAVEMTELRTILTLADAASLVLGDELCSGTESDSALSIFTAGLEILHARESTFLFATHFHEIKNYEEIALLKKMKMYHMAVQYNPAENRLIYDRKLREGPGESMYGLEVCKSLHLPEAFLERAHSIRQKYQSAEKNILALSPSHFNAKKLVGNCELCQKHQASEVHHLQPQKKANSINNYIKNETTGQTFHKNHLANLLNICEECHKKIHKTADEHKVVKTTDGYMLVKI